MSGQRFWVGASCLVVLFVLAIPSTGFAQADLPMSVAAAGVSLRFFDGAFGGLKYVAEGWFKYWIPGCLDHTARAKEPVAGGFVEMSGELAKLAPKRTDIVTWFDLLDLDDYVSFGGKG